MRLLSLALGFAHVLSVGPAHEFARIEDAVRVAIPGDLIEVFPDASAYREVAVRITKPRLTITGEGKVPIELNGAGFDYSGVGRIPRAIFQVDPGADGTSIRNFILSGAHNQSHNGAGVRINGARNVSVSRCEVLGNDMGIMSNGGQAGADASDQSFIDCHIHHNGDAADPGYNHNLY